MGAAAGERTTAGSKSILPKPFVPRKRKSVGNRRFESSPESDRHDQTRYAGHAVAPISRPQFPARTDHNLTDGAEHFVLGEPVVEAGPSTSSITCVEASAPRLLSCRPMIDAAKLQHFQAHGYLHLENWLDSSEVAAFANWTAELEAWPDTPGRWMRYYEKAPGGDSRMLARIENFLPHHEGIGGFFQGARLKRLLEALTGESFIVFKDKINLKAPGGAGFTPHQDGPAYVGFGAETFVTAMLPIDPFTVENGCLEMARAASTNQVLPQNPDGTVRQDVADSLEWEALLAKPGDLILFDSWVPHRSARNQSSSRRRSYYVTYNPQAAGDHREAYYARKRELFPQECERKPGVDYAKLGAQFNLANPFD